MAILDELVTQIENPDLRARIAAEVEKLAKQKKFGLVFEEHLPECTPLWDIPVKKGSKAALKAGQVSDFYTVLKIENGIATCLNKDKSATAEFAVDELVSVAEFGEPIYPYLKPLDTVCNAPNSDLWHTLIEADNYHALQLLEYLYAGKVDCISEATVYDVVKALQDEEGATIPTDIEAEEMGYDNYDTLSLRPTYTTPPRQPGRSRSYDPNQMTLFDLPGFGDNPPEQPTGETAPVNPAAPAAPSAQAPAPQTHITPATGNEPITPEAGGAQPTSATQPASQQQPTAAPATPPQDFPDIDREAVVKAINDAGLLTYNVRRVRITDYLKSMYALARFLTQTRIDMDAKETVISEITEKIHEHISLLKQRGMYDDLVGQVLQFKLSAQIFDVFGRSIDDYAIHDLFSTTDTDIERQFRLAETRLGNEGVGNAYVNRYYDEDDVLNLKIQVIIFAANTDCMDALNEYAEQKFHDLNDANRRRTVSLPEKFKKKYDDIVSDGDIISKHNFRLPETIRVPHEMEGRLYSNHLFVDDSGTALINLNGWERKVIAEEEQQEDFVCWLRNPSRGSWALCIPYEIDGEKKPTYPDFLIIRRDGSEYVVDILEPHDPTRQDNLGKAKGFAEYARQNPGVGRIQLIRMQRDSVGRERAFRLDMSKSSIRDKVSRCASNDELNHIFESDGFFQ